jgi:hypothetical protein
VLTAFGSRPVGPGLPVPEQTDSRPEAGTDLSTCHGAMLRNLGTEGMVAEDGPRFSGRALPLMLQPRAIRECGSSIGV